MVVQPAPHRFSVAEYHQMAEAGIFGEDDRVELLDGEIVEMAAIGSCHAACVKRLNHALAGQVGDQATIAVQDPIRLGEHSEPQPDLALLQPRADYYASGHPTPEDVLLVVEVADTTAAWDRDHKLPLYAAWGVPEVWLVDLAAGVVEIYRRPVAGAYSEVHPAGPGDSVTPHAYPSISVAVEDVLA